MPYHTTPHHAKPRLTMMNHTSPCHTTAYHDEPQLTMPYHSSPWWTPPHHAIPQITMPYHTTPRHTTPHHDEPHHTMPYHTSGGKNLSGTATVFSERTKEEWESGWREESQDEGGWCLGDLVDRLSLITVRKAAKEMKEREWKGYGVLRACIKVPHTSFISAW